MVLAFGKLSSATGGGADPQALAGDISLALYTTADGLVIAIPLTSGGNEISDQTEPVDGCNGRAVERFLPGVAGRDGLRRWTTLDCSKGEMP